MLGLAWERGKDENDSTIYTAFTGAGERVGITSYGRGEFRAQLGESGAWAESLEEAKIIAEALTLGLDVTTHKTNCWYQRNAVPPRGSWTTIWKWRCSCGQRNSGGDDRAGAHERARDHRIGALREMIEERMRLTIEEAK